MGVDMPVKLRIPEHQAPSLAEFLRLSQADLDALLQSIREEEPGLALSRLIETIASRLSIDRQRTNEIIGLLASLERVKEGRGLQVKEFFAELRAAMEASGKDDLKPADWSAFQEAIEAALSDESAFAISTKALGVMADHAKVFCDGRVLTDLRPVFRSSADQEPLAFITLHTLKIAYHEHSNGKHREFFVAMDRNDIHKLISVLERALKKEASLKALTSEKGLRVFEVET